MSRRNPERTYETYKKVVRSTREKTRILQPAVEGETINMLTNNHHYIYVKVTDMNHTINTDQTGKFPVTSRSGHKYLMIICEVDINAISAEPMKTKNEKEIICTSQTLPDRLKECGIKIERHILDNDISDA